jgi:hypothetical protein
MQSKAPCCRVKTHPRFGRRFSTSSSLRLVVHEVAFCTYWPRTPAWPFLPSAEGTATVALGGGGCLSAAPVRGWCLLAHGDVRALNLLVRGCYVYSTARNNSKIASMDSQTGRATPGTSCVRHSCAVGAVSLVKRRTRLRAQRPKQSSGAHVRRGPHKNSRSNGSSAALLQRPL